MKIEYRVRKVSNKPDTLRTLGIPKTSESNYLSALLAINDFGAVKLNDNGSFE